MSGECSASAPLGMQVSARYLFRQRRCSLERFNALQASLQTVTTCRPRVYLSIRCGNHTGALAGRRRIWFNRGAISCTARPDGLCSTSVDPSDHSTRSLPRGDITVPSLRCPHTCGPANQVPLSTKTLEGPVHQGGPCWPRSTVAARSDQVSVLTAAAPATQPSAMQRANFRKRRKFSFSSKSTV
jgi:hypothetical protein